MQSAQDAGWMSTPNLLELPPRRVLIVVEDAALAELLLELLREAGHEAVLAEGQAGLGQALDGGVFDAMIVDLDTRSRSGPVLIEELRARSPSTTVIALLPCGGLPPRPSQIPYHLAIEKPTRLNALLAAVSLAHHISSH
jgi:DNA-binding NtrC family response regulator